MGDSRKHCLMCGGRAPCRRHQPSVYWSSTNYKPSNQDWIWKLMLRYSGGTAVSIFEKEWWSPSTPPPARTYYDKSLRIPYGDTVSLTHG